MSLDATRAVLAHLAGKPPPTLDSAPKQVVFRRDKLRLLRAAPAVDGPALVLIPPLMVKPYIYDLSPGHSLVRAACNAGFDTFVVDFGVPDRRDRAVRLDDYVLDYVPACLDAALQASGRDRLGVLGYCMGGLFGLIHVGTHRDERVQALVTIASPVNFREMRLIHRLARLGAPAMNSVIDLVGNVPGEVSSLVFKLLTGRRTLTNYWQLVRHLNDPEYVAAFRAINYWVNDLIPYPMEAYRQMFWDVVMGNKLLSGELEFAGARCDPRQLRCPLLAFAGDQDVLAPPDAIREIVEIVGARDKQFVEARGGHVGVMAGSAAPARVWRPALEWLAARMQPGRRRTGPSCSPGGPAAGWAASPPAAAPTR